MYGLPLLLSTNLKWVNIVYRAIVFTLYDIIIIILLYFSSVRLRDVISGFLAACSRRIGVKHQERRQWDLQQFR